MLEQLRTGLDALGRPSSTSRVLNGVEVSAFEWTWDPRGRPLSRSAWVDGGFIGLSRWAWYADGSLEAETTPSGRVLQHQRSLSSEGHFLLDSLLADGAPAVEILSRDGALRPTTLRVGGARDLSLSWDGQGRLTQKQAGPGLGAGPMRWSGEYDERGRLAFESVEDEAGTSSHEYSFVEPGWLGMERHTERDGSRWGRDYLHDSSGRRVAQSDGDSAYEALTWDGSLLIQEGETPITTSPFDEVTDDGHYQLRYDPDGELNALSDSDGPLLDLNRDPDGRPLWELDAAGAVRLTHYGLGAGPLGHGELPLEIEAEGSISTPIVAEGLWLGTLTEYTLYPSPPTTLMESCMSRLSRILVPRRLIPAALLTFSQLLIPAQASCPSHEQDAQGRCPDEVAAERAAAKAAEEKRVEDAQALREAKAAAARKAKDEEARQATIAAKTAAACHEHAAAARTLSTGAPTGRAWTTLKTSPAAIGFIELSAGTFSMGSEAGVGDSDEHPQHDVSLSGFAIGCNEVTQWQWAVVVKAAKAKGITDAKDLPVDPAYNKGAQLPVETVSWCQAARFANSLSRLEGLTPAYTVSADCEQGGTVTWNRQASGFRLPTEAEWEYAARAGTQTVYATGDTEQDLARAGWYDDNSGGKTHEVCTAAERPWGLCDMHGNVWEWAWDWYADSYSPGEAKDPTGPELGTCTAPGCRVLRGGSWVDAAVNPRSANRSWGRPSFTGSWYGVRLVLPVVPPEP